MQCQYCLQPLKNGQEEHYCYESQMFAFNQMQEHYDSLKAANQAKKIESLIKIEEQPENKQQKEEVKKEEQKQPIQQKQEPKPKHSSFQPSLKSQNECNQCGFKAFNKNYFDKHLCKNKKCPVTQRPIWQSGAYVRLSTCGCFYNQVGFDSYYRDYFGKRKCITCQQMIRKSMDGEVLTLYLKGNIIQTYKRMASYNFPAYQRRYSTLGNALPQQQQQASQSLSFQEQLDMYKKKRDRGAETTQPQETPTTQFTNKFDQSNLGKRGTYNESSSKDLSTDKVNEIKKIIERKNKQIQQLEAKLMENNQQKKKRDQKREDKQDFKQSNHK